ncbi:alpha/beta hydrolase [uncultured Maribacter sp.]|uniref:alpha/beta hydrolase n=1 Tax=uncultured Maribacter sp. TaxID=431308 RepID=UPI0030DD250B|tara:strand:- start:1341 stop:2756 length:1416 start_codon:yes stop_codon:yes gene_type:complete
MMKKILFFALVLFSTSNFSQELRLLKGSITENVVVNDSLKETISLYLPSTFEVQKPWPVIFVFDLKGKGKASVSMLVNAAEKEGYILASSDNVTDSISISENVLIANRMFNALINIVPIAKNRTYTAGFGSGAMFASILPTFIKEIKGVVSIGASIGNIEILNAKHTFQFIGIVNRSDYSFRDMLDTQQILNKLKFPNELLVFDDDRILPDVNTIASAFRILTLTSMAKGDIHRNDSFIAESYSQFLTKANSFVSIEKPILANYLLTDMEKVFNPLLELDSLKISQKSLRRSTSYKKANRSQNSYFLKESFLKEDYSYYLEEDIVTYNYANLGWWNYQMEDLSKLDKSVVLYERQMSSRLRGYINALISDNIDFISVDKEVDSEALKLLYMIRTITDPSDYSPYLKVISSSAKIEDYGTALFYLEELLKNGYTNKSELYELEDTALFRITPEFNMLVEKYLKDARYEIIEQ